MSHYQDTAQSDARDALLKGIAECAKALEAQGGKLDPQARAEVLRALGQAYGAVVGPGHAGTQSRY